MLATLATVTAICGQVPVTWGAWSASTIKPGTQRPAPAMPTSWAVPRSLQACGPLLYHFNAVGIEGEIVLDHDDGGEWNLICPHSRRTAPRREGRCSRRIRPCRGSRCEMPPTEGFSIGQLNAGPDNLMSNSAGQ